MNPRRAALVGLVFVVIAVFYWRRPAWSRAGPMDYAGFTMLLALGAAMSIMAYVLFAGLRRELTTPADDRGALDQLIGFTAAVRRPRLGGAGRR